MQHAGQLGRPEGEFTFSIPVLVDTTLRWSAVAASDMATGALERETGTAYTW